VIGLTLSACGGLPGTTAYDIEKAKRIIVETLIDPSSVQFRNTREHNGWVCGELNGKNRLGAYVGFKRFVVKLDKSEGLVDPGFEFSDLVAAQDACSSLATNSYASLSTKMSACNQETEQRASQLLQTNFDRDWSANCGPARARSVYQPSLIDPSIAEPANELASESTLMSSPTDDEPADDEGAVVEEAARPAASVTTQSDEADEQWLDEVWDRNSPSSENALSASESEDLR
jgi:hypothetical protein